MSRSVTQRRSAILELLTHGPQKVRDLAELLDISAVTIRRDIDQLANQGLLIRRHGVALPLSEDVPTPRSQATVGLVVPHSNYYYDGIIEGAKRACAEAGSRLILGVSAYNQLTEVQQTRRLIANRVDGIVIAPTPNNETGLLSTKQERWLASLTVPAVLVERPPSISGPAARLDSVTSAHAAGAATAVRHLAGLGHERLACLIIQGPNSAPIQSGYVEAVAALGLPSLGVISEGRPGSSDAAPELHRLVRDGATGLFIHNDQLATRALTWLEDSGTRVPQDVSIVGYDDVIAAYAPIPLTSVSPPLRSTVGYRATLLLLSRIRAIATGGESAPSPGEHIYLMPRLIERDSTGTLG